MPRYEVQPICVPYGPATILDRGKMFVSLRHGSHAALATPGREKKQFSTKNGLSSYCT